MENSKHVLWFPGGIIIGAAMGIAAVARIGSSETTRLNRNLRARSEKAKQAFVMEAGDIATMIWKNLTHPIPDLYKATENLTIGQPETDYDW